MATVRKEGRYYYAHWWVWSPSERRRVRYRKSTHQTVKSAAQATADQWEREATDPDAAARAAETLGGAIARWLASITTRVDGGQLARGTGHCYRVKAGNLARVFEHRGDPTAARVALPLASITAEHVDAYVATRAEEGARPHTIHKELTALRCALKLSRKLRKWQGDPAAVLPEHYGPQYEPRERWLPSEELRALLNELPEHRAAVVAFVVATSAEWGCVERARRGDVRNDKSTAHLRGTKTDTRSRTVPVELDWQRQLIALALAHADGKDGALFSTWGNVRRDLHAACKRAQIAPCSPNDLRRTCCHYLLQSGASERIAAKVLGHANSRMVRKVYGAANDTEAAEHLRALRRGELPPGATPPDFGEGPRTAPEPAAPSTPTEPAVKLTAPRTRNPRDLLN